MKIVEIDLNKIEQNENSRVVYKETDTAELMSSMRKNGLLQPIGVKPLPNGKYDCVWGNRRVLAAKRLGWDKIPASILTDLENDSDRDIIGLIENMKRTNTTAAEDGRMFTVLMSRGLSIDEVAARLDVTKQRIQVALDVMNTVPQEFHKKIKFSDVKKARGDISAATANAILTIRKNEGLNRPQMRSMFQWASTHRPSADQLLKVAPLLKEGYTIGEAIEKVAQLVRVTIHVYLPEKVAERLEKKTGTTMAEQFREYLRGNKEFKIQEPDMKHIPMTKLKSVALSSGK